MAQPRHDVIANLLPHQVALFWPKVDTSGGDGACWAWQGAVHPNGYGTWTVNVGQGRTTSVRPHRVAWSLTRGPLSGELTIDHLCRNRLCCNPDHLEPVPITVNVSRQPPRRKLDSHGASIRERPRRDGTMTYAVLFRCGGKQTSRTFVSRSEAEALVNHIKAYGATGA